MTPQLERCRLERRIFRAVGTTCLAAVTTRDGELRLARAALDAAVREVEACERALSRFDAASDLSRLNAGAGTWVAVDVRLREALRLALRARAATGGRFDPTILPALAAAGYDRSFEQIEARPPRRLEHWRPGAAVEVGDDGRARVVRGAAVDLGGIGKGYAADRALAAMRSAWPRLPGALVDLGGDVALAGETPEGGPWRIDVGDPHHPPAVLGRLAVCGGGIATSGRAVRRFGPGGALHHLIDPATGAPAVPGPLAVTVVARDAAEAEAHATALAIASDDEAAAHVRRNPHVAALVVPQAGAPRILGELPLVRRTVVVRAAA
ncbi:MAG TPA: FAD:protein FMN transferase [Gaiellaceae bacterium]|nr:FAD:protein FMN transferase [Gaiellaceae bacterium]